MIAYKGTELDMTCLGFQYELNKEYTIEGELELCKNGFHACLNPLDVLKYYSPRRSRYFIVEQTGNIIKQNDKQVSSKIKFIEEITLQDLARMADVGIESCTSNIRNSNNPMIIASNDTIVAKRINQKDEDIGVVAISNKDSGIVSCEEGTYCGTAITTSLRSAAISESLSESIAITLGIGSIAKTLGSESKAICTGIFNTAIAENDYSLAIALDNNSTAKVTGKNSIAATFGRNSVVVSGPIGGAIFAVERDPFDNIINVGSAIVDGENIKPFTSYKLYDGKFKEVSFS